MIERSSVTWCADPSDRVASRRAHVREPQDATLELKVREQMRQAEVLVRILAAENLHTKSLLQLPSDT